MSQYKLFRFILGKTLRKLETEANPNKSAKLKKEAEKLRLSLKRAGFHSGSDEQYCSSNPNNEKINYE